MPQTPRLALPLISAGQAQKDVTHNEAILALDRLIALVVVSDSAVVPPASPADGEAWIVPPAGAAAWGHAAGTLMHRCSSAWIAEPPRDGQMALLAGTGHVLVYAGAWHAVHRIGAATAIALPSGGTTIDSEARNALAVLVSVLQQHGIVMQSA